MRERQAVRRFVALGAMFKAAASASLSYGGAVAIDGSLGKAPSNVAKGANGTYAVTPALGKQIGQNLFFSFSQFDLGKGEVAAFSGPGSGIANVLSRVTSGSPSNIDGTIRCTIPRANFYLVNPAGVVFGPDAALDVQGSFAVTTADFVRLADGTQFNAATAQAPVLQTTAPAAFGFLATKPAGVSIGAATLAVPAGQTLSIVGGDIQIAGGMLEAAGGRVNLVSTGSPGSVLLDPTSINAAIELQGFSALGNLGMSQGAVASAQGPGGGRVVVRGGNLAMDQSSITAVTLADQPSLGIDIVLTGDLQMIGGGIAADTLGSGNAGNVSIAAHSISVDGGNPTTLAGISADTVGAGRAGEVQIQASSLQLTQGGVLSSSTVGPGDGGAVDLTVGSLLSDARGSTQGTGIFAFTGSSGHGGNVNVQADNAQILNGAGVFMNPTASGNAGQFSATGGNITIDGGSAGLLTGVFTGPIIANVTGHTGGIQVQADSLQLLRGGLLNASPSSQAVGHGPGGAVNINASSLLLDSGDSKNIAAITSSGDPAGTLKIQAGSLQVLNGARILGDSNGAGAGANLSVTAGSLLLDAGAPARLTDIQSDALFSGPGGSVEINAGTLQLLRGATIDASTLSSGAAGSISINATNIGIGPAPGTALAGIIANSDGAAAGNGGAIDIHAANIQSNHGTIEADTMGTGVGGNVSVMANAITLENQASIGSQSQAAGTGGNAGNLKVRATSLQLFSGATISSNTDNNGAAGTVAVNSSRLTIDGRGSNIITGIGSQASAAGAAGTVIVKSNVLKIRHGGIISSGTRGLGLGGDVTVMAKRLELDGSGSRLPTSITAATDSPGNGGDAGRVHVESGNIILRGGSSISSSTFGGGNGGSVTVAARDITLIGAGSNDASQITATSESHASGAGTAGSVSVNASGQLRLTRSTIRVAASEANGGNLRIVAGQLSLRGSGILTEAHGDGGSISVAGGFAAFAHGRVSANGGNNGGNIAIHPAVFLRNDTPISATGRAGVSGLIHVTTPDQALAGSLVRLP